MEKAATVSPERGATTMLGISGWMLAASGSGSTAGVITVTGLLTGSSAGVSAAGPVKDKALDVPNAYAQTHQRRQQRHAHRGPHAPAGRLPLSLRSGGPGQSSAQLPAAQLLPLPPHPAGQLPLVAQHHRLRALLRPVGEDHLPPLFHVVKLHMFLYPYPFFASLASREDLLSLAGLASSASCTVKVKVVTPS